MDKLYYRTITTTILKDNLTAKNRTINRPILPPGASSVHPDQGPGVAYETGTRPPLEGPYAFSRLPRKQKNISPYSNSKFCMFLLNFKNEIKKLNLEIKINAKLAKSKKPAQGVKEFNSTDFEKSTVNE